MSGGDALILFAIGVPTIILGMFLLAGFVATFAHLVVWFWGMM